MGIVKWILFKNWKFLCYFMKRTNFLLVRMIKILLTLIYLHSPYQTLDCCLKIYPIKHLNIFLLLRMNEYLKKWNFSALSQSINHSSPRFLYKFTFFFTFFILIQVFNTQISSTEKCLSVEFALITLR